MEEKLRPIIIDNKIMNLAELLEGIPKCADEEFLQNYYDETLRYNPNTLTEGLEELRDALSARLNTLGKAKTNNVKILKDLQEKNPKLTRLEIIETKKEINDNNMDIDYLLYKNEEGNIRLLECQSPKTLSDLLSENAAEALSGTPEDVFNYFNYYKYHEMEFLKSNQFLEKYPLLNDNIIKFQQEVSEIEKYIQKSNIHIEPEIAINTHGERLYKLGSLIIKFHNENNLRKMVIINNTALNQKLLNHSVPEKYNLSEINNILAKLYDGHQIREEDKTKLSAFMKNGLKDMSEYELHYDYQNTIDIYIVYLENKSNLKQLSKEENNLLREYQNIIRTREEKITNSEFLTQNNQKTLKLIPKDLNTNGAIITVAILETTILLGILISVLALVKR